MMACFVMMTQFSAYTQNHLWAVNKLDCVPNTNGRGLNLKYAVHMSFCIKFNYNAMPIQLHCAWFSSIIHINSHWSFSLPGHGCSREADMGTQALAQAVPIIQLLCWNSRLLMEMMNHLLDRLNWGLSIQHSYLPTPAVGSMAALLTGTAPLPQHMIKTVGPEQTLQCLPKLSLWGVKCES